MRMGEVGEKRMRGSLIAGGVRMRMGRAREKRMSVAPLVGGAREAMVRGGEERMDVGSPGRRKAGGGGCGLFEMVGGRVKVSTDRGRPRRQRVFAAHLGLDRWLRMRKVARSGPRPVTGG